jgi:hypothetical protein
MNVPTKANAKEIKVYGQVIKACACGAKMVDEVGDALASCNECGRAGKPSRVKLFAYYHRNPLKRLFVQTFRRAGRVTLPKES